MWHCLDCPTSILVTGFHSPLVSNCSTETLTSADTVQHTPHLTRKLETWLPDCRVSHKWKTSPTMMNNDDHLLPYTWWMLVVTTNLVLIRRAWKLYSLNGSMALHGCCQWITYNLIICCSGCDLPRHLYCHWIVSVQLTIFWQGVCFRQMWQTVEHIVNGCPVIAKFHYTDPTRQSPWTLFGIG